MFDNENILKNIVLIIDKLIKKSPLTKLYIQSIRPVNAEKLLIDKSINTTIYRVNNELRNICIEKKIIFIDIHPDFLNKKGEMNSIYTYDGVHLTEQGYILWSELLQTFL
ncbi:MAG: hypothetical protein B6D61_07375 [Bacteroidetes bacterium 4484_249]|nr:MAG: hypothetical protein B6D61_07375 [Bacteroidetes bacterium 4484_249]